MVKVELSKISKTFNDNQVLNNIRLTIEDGEYFCLIGPSSAGKTTTLKIIAGLYAPDSGKVLLDGRDVTNIESWERGVAMMFQNPTLFTNMTVLENILFPMREKGMNDVNSLKEAEELLRKIHMEKRADAFPNELSGGMQQRVALARAMASGTKLLLLDEPLGALDARLRLELREELRQFAKENGLTVIHVTQDQDEAMAVADRIALIKDGKITQVAKPSEIYLHPSSPFVMNFIEGTNFLDAYVEDKNDSIMDLVIENTYHRVKAYGNFMVGERVLVCLRPSAIKIVKRKGGQLFTQVQHKTVMGSYVVVDTALFGPNKPLTIETSFKEAMKFKENDVVSLNIDIADLRVFRYPLLGFMKEVELSI